MGRGPARVPPSGAGRSVHEPLSAAASAPRVLNPGEPGEPLEAQADALNGDTERATNLMTGRHL